MTIFYCKFKNISKNWHAIEAPTKDLALKKFIKDTKYRPSEVIIRKTISKTDRYSGPSKK